MSRILVPRDGPLFEGHFPGRPILPGVTTLILAARALAPPGGDGNVRAVPHVRFRELVGPGDELDVGSRPVEGTAAVRFELRRGGRLVVSGAIEFGAPDEDAAQHMAQASRAPRGALPLAELLPHRPPMLFVRRILGEADDGATCLASIPHDCGLVAQGSAPALAGLEIAAQTAAAWEALRRRREGGEPGAKIGYLVSARDVLVHCPAIPADADVIASIRVEAVAPPLSTYAAEIVVEGAIAVRGTIGTYLT